MYIYIYMYIYTYIYMYIYILGKFELTLKYSRKKKY